MERPVLIAALSVIAMACAGCTSGGTATIDTGTVVTTPLPANIELVESGPILCADPSRRDEAVFDYIEAAAEPDKAAWFWGGGILSGDLDGDGQFDMILPGFWETFLYAGDADGTFRDRSVVLDGLPVRGASGGSMADYDGDGDLDVLVTRFQQPNTLLRNDDGVLIDVSIVSGMPTEARRTMASSWGDFDGDGDLDLFLGNYGFIDQSRVDADHANFLPADPSWLLLNNGDGTFSDISDRLPQAVHDGYTFSGGFIDVDRDGALDFYVVNDFGNSYPNVFLHGDGAGGLEQGDQLGLDIAMTGMGLGIGDLNSDGYPDFAMTEWNGNWLLESAAGGSIWVDYSESAGFVNDIGRTQKVGWGVELADLDNDGDLDAPMAYGYLDSTYQASQKQPDALYLQAEDGSFNDVGPAWGMNHPTIGRGFALIDANNDGWLDVIKRDLAGPTIYCRSRCGTAAWLRVRLHDDATANRFAVGAHVIATVGDRSMERTVYAGTVNHASGGPPEVHFGLGGNQRIDSLEVRWPDGERSVLGPIDGRQIIDVTRTP